MQTGPRGRQNVFTAPNVRPSPNHVVRKQLRLFPLLFPLRGDVHVTVMLWSTNMLLPHQQHSPTTVMISSSSTGMVPAATSLMPLSNQDIPGSACQHVLVCLLTASRGAGLL